MGNVMPLLQVDDIQGIILHGYGGRDNAWFLMLAIGDDVPAARSWLGRLDLRSSQKKPEGSDTCINIAFTADGLQKIGLPQEQRDMLAGEFVEGMTGVVCKSDVPDMNHRRRALGDHGSSSPEQWRWGGPNTGKIDILLMLYAPDRTAVDALLAQQLQLLTAAGLRVIEKLESRTLKGRKEHFGFRDGISQPLVEGSGLDGPPGNTVAAGEFLLGYQNAYEQFTDRPTVKSEADPQNLLPTVPDDASRHDLGKNGSYLVFRQLKQDVHAFWNALAEKAPRMLSDDPVQSCVALASKMVGRWPSGAPLVNSPAADNPALQDDNDFLYFGSNDADGLKCPIGSHVRRSNPRDSLDPNPGSESSIKVGKRHRIIRRSRVYGAPVVESMDTAEIIGSADDQVERGLHFICFNTQIGRQFEFIQHTWVNSPKFDGLYEDDDPIAGDRGAGHDMPGGTFTVQQEPIRKRVTGLPRFVTTVGGSYFFMPGLRAVRYLASLK
jgi:Dyp-type peroxidase family